MNQIIKHSFEAVSLLATDNGLLQVTIIPAMNQPDWIIPSNLILSVDDYDERVWTYLWQQQEVAVFHLLPHECAPNKIIVLEGNTPVHRLALQTAGELHQTQVRISDVKDAELPERYQHAHTTSDSAHSGDMIEERFTENIVTSYAFQAVTIDDVFYLIPDLDKIAHQLVDLDS